jgi:hypothetical protein
MIRVKHPDEVDEVLARRVAGETLADVRTVRRALRGERVRGLLGTRIAEAIRAHRMENPSPGLDGGGP